MATDVTIVEKEIAGINMEKMMEKIMERIQMWLEKTSVTKTRMKIQKLQMETMGERIILNAEMENRADIKRKEDAGSTTLMITRTEGTSKQKNTRITKKPLLIIFYWKQWPRQQTQLCSRFRRQYIRRGT